MLPKLALRTSNRNDFISLFGKVAECFPPPVFHDRQNVPVIIIKGDTSVGKSLAAEAMMKTWSDEHDLNDVFEKEREHMFLEVRAGEAVETLSRTFNVYGKKAAMYFNSDGIGFSPEQKAKKEIEASKSVQGGAIFISDIGIFDEEYSQGQWVSVSVELPAQKITKSMNLWERDLDITVTHSRLVEDPHFQRNWQRLLSKGLGF